MGILSSLNHFFSPWLKSAACWLPLHNVRVFITLLKAPFSILTSLALWGWPCLLLYQQKWGQRCDLLLRLNLSSCPYPHPFPTPLLPHQKATGPLLFKDILSTCTFDLGAACGEVIKSTALKSVRNAVETQRRIWEWPGEKFLPQDTIFRLSM